MKEAKENRTAWDRWLSDPWSADEGRGDALTDSYDQNCTKINGTEKESGDNDERNLSFLKGSEACVESIKLSSFIP